MDVQDQVEPDVKMMSKLDLLDEILGLPQEVCKIGRGGLHDYPFISAEPMLGLGIWLMRIHLKPISPTVRPTKASNGTCSPPVPG